MVLMKDKKIFVFYYMLSLIILFILQHVFSINLIISSIISMIILIIIVNLNAKYYFLPGDHRKTMKAMDKTMKEIMLKYDMMENELE